MQYMIYLQKKKNKPRPLNQDFKTPFPKIKTKKGGGGKYNSRVPLLIREKKIRVKKTGEG